MKYVTIESRCDSLQLSLKQYYNRDNITIIGYWHGKLGHFRVLLKRTDYKYAEYGSTDIPTYDDYIKNEEIWFEQDNIDTFFEDEQEK